MRYQDTARRTLGELKARQAQLQLNRSSSISAPLIATPIVQQRDETLAQRSIRLPALQLQAFSGEICKWPGSWEQFKASVHQNEGLTKGEKFQYLRNLLSGIAATATEGLQATEECYDDAIDILKSRFGDQRLFVQEHLRRL